MYIEYDNSTSFGFCSLHCAALDLALMIDKMPKSIMVADYGSKKLIEAEKAIWVFGGSKPGVMSKRAKLDFENKTDAEAFSPKITFIPVLRVVYFFQNGAIRFHSRY